MGTQVPNFSTSTAEYGDPNPVPYLHLYELAFISQAGNGLKKSASKTLLLCISHKSKIKADSKGDK